MLCLNALLAAYEMALASVSRTKLSILAQENRQGAASALFLKDHIEGALAVVQIGITLAAAVAAAAGGAGAADGLTPFLQTKFAISKAFAHTLSIIFLVVPLSLITIVFAELVPKTFAIKNKEFVVLLLSPFMRVCYGFLLPMVSVMEKIVAFLTRKKVVHKTDENSDKKAALEDLRAAAAIASSSRLFGKIEEKIVLSSAFFSIRRIKEIQIPLSDVYVLFAGDTIADTFIKAHLDMHTRFPVTAVQGDKQTIIGYLNFKDIFAATKTTPGQTPNTRAILRPIISLDGSTLISAALQQMTREHHHISLVTENGKITGIITLEDIFEEMVGEIEDEYDYFTPYLRRFGGSLIASAAAKMQNVFKELDLPAPPSVTPALSVEEWAAKHLGRAVSNNDKIIAEGLRMEARKFRRTKVMEVVFTPYKEDAQNA
jgi:putative hemolysin